MEGEVGGFVAVALLVMLKLGDKNVFSVSEQTLLMFVLETTAIAAVVAKAGPLLVLLHQVLDLLWVAAVQGKGKKNKKTTI